MPELVGRFPVLVPFHSLNKELLVRVLTEPKNSLLAQMKLQFSLDGVSSSGHFAFILFRLNLISLPMLWKRLPTWR